MEYALFDSVRAMISLKPRVLACAQYAFHLADSISRRKSNGSTQPLDSIIARIYAAIQLVCLARPPRL